MAKIEKVAVLGAGVMGAAIAAHVANAGVPVALLDIVPDGAGEGAEARSTLARGAMPSGPPSSLTPASRVTSAARASGDSSPPVTAMTRPP